MLKTVTPIDNSILVERKYASEVEIDTALQNSYEAREQWKETSLSKRKEVVRNFVKSFLSNSTEINKNLCKQIGRPISQCPGEMRGFEERANYMIENSDRALEDVVSRKDDEFDNYIKKEPLGTILLLLLGTILLILLLILLYQVYCLVILLF